VLQSHIGVYFTYVAVPVIITSGLVMKLCSLGSKESSIGEDEEMETVAGLSKKVRSGEPICMTSSMTNYKAAPHIAMIRVRETSGKPVHVIYN
jgi:hypothetical protein